MLEGFSDLDFVIHAPDNVGDAFDTISNAIAGMNISDVQKLFDGLSTPLSDNIQNELITVANSINDISASSNNAINSTGKLADTFTGIGSSLASFIINPVTLSIAGIAALTTAYTYFATSYSRAQSDFSESSTAYQSTKSEVNGLNSELEKTTTRIQQLTALNNSGTISFAEKEELNQLTQANIALERQLELKKSILQIQANAQAADALKASKEEMSSTELLSNSTGLPTWLIGLQQVVGTISGTNQVNAGINQHFATNDTTAEGMLEHQIKTSSNYKNELDSLYKARSNSDTQEEYDSIQKKIETTESAYSSATQAIYEYSNQIQSWIDASYDGNGNIIAGSETQVREWKDLLTSVQNIGKTESQIGENSINNFFDGSTGKDFIKNELMQAASQGKNLEDVLSSLGIKLSDIGKGVTNDSLTKYFNGLVKSAKDAAEAINSVDGSFEGVQAAQSTPNQGNEWDSMAQNLKKGQDLYEKGLIGTDDFQSMAQWMAPDKINTDGYKYDAEAYKQAWENTYTTVSGWFNAENPLESMWNFANDLNGKNSNMFSTLNQETGEMVPNFNSTAEAAKELGVSVQAVETVLGKLKEYGFEFDGVMFSGEGIEEYKTSLEGIREITNGLEDGSKKERLLGLLDGWDENYKTYEQDLSQLTEEQVVQIRFEYDLAQLQQNIENLREQAKSSDSNEDWAALNVASKEYRETREEQTGYTEDSDAGYKNSYDTITDMQSSLRGKSDVEKADINRQISAVYDLQNAFQDLRADGSDFSWDEFLNTSQAQDVFNTLIESSGLARDELEEIFGTEITLPPIRLEGEFDLDELSSNIEELEVGQAIAFTATIDDVEQQIEGIKNEDGSITYTTDIEGVETEVLPFINPDGTITYIANVDDLDSDEFAVEAAISYVMDSQETPESKEALMNYIKENQDDPDFRSAFMDYVKTSQQNPDNAQAFLDYLKNSQEAAANQKAGIDYEVGSQQKPNTSLPGTIDWGVGSVKKPSLILSGVIKWFSNGATQLLGTAHKNGTVNTPPFFKRTSTKALADGTLQDNSWLKQRWKTKDHQVALTGEVGQELVVHGNRWWTVGDNGAEFASIPQGSVVFNARQTRDLFSKGFTNSRGTAHLSGTAYADGSADQAAKDALKELSNYFNWITINMDRLSRQSKLASNAIETAVTLNEKQAATSKALSKVQDERSGATQSADRYLQHAQWYAGESKLSADLQKKVQTGSVDISKYDENTQTKIKEYQQYYDKYLDMLDKATELQKKEADLAEKRLKNIEDAYKLVIKVSESLQDMNDAKLKYDEALGYSSVSDQVKSVYTASLNEAQSIYDNLLLELTDYESEFSALVKSGYIKEGSEQWNEALIKLNNINKELSKTGKTIVEYQDKIRETTYDKLENLIAGFERAIKSTDAKLSLSKARDENVSESVYQAQMNNNNGQIQGHMKLREEKLKELALYDVDSGKYQKIAKEINNLDKETYNLLSDNEKLKDSIFKLRFSPLDEAIEKYQDLRSELGKFQGLLNKDAFFDKNGLITEEGLANLAILQQQMGAAKKEIADYQTGLDKLAESYTNGVISEKEYNEKSQDYRKGIQEAAKDVVDYKDKLTDLYMTQMKTEVKALQEVIDKRKDALDAKADYYDYDKKLKTQTKDVNVLKAQIAAMEGVNDAATQAKVKQLKQQLANAEDKLSETKQDHSMDMQKQGYNGLSDDMEKMLDDTEYEIIHNSEKQQSVIENMLNNVVNMYQSAYGKINTIIAETGWAGSTDFNTGQTQLGTQTGAAAQTAGATQSQSSVASSGAANSTKTNAIKNDDDYHKNTVETILAKPENITNRLVAEVKLSPTSVTLEEGQSTTISIQSIRPSDAKNKGLSWKTKNAQIASVSNGTIKGVSPGSCSIVASTTDGSNISASVSVTVTKKPDPPKPQPTPEPAKSGRDGIPNIGDAVTFADGIYYLDSYGTAPSGNQMKGQTVYITYMNPGAPYSIHISRTPRPGEHDLGWLSLNQIRGYKSGSKRIDQEQLAWTQENGRELIMRKADGAMLTKLNPGDAIAPNNLTENLFKWGSVDPNTFLANAINTTTALPSMSDLKQNITIEQHYDSLIHVDGNVDQDVLADLKSYEKDFLNKSYKYTTNMIAKDCQKVGIRRK